MTRYSGMFLRRAGKKTVGIETGCFFLLMLCLIGIALCPPSSSAGMLEELQEKIAELWKSAPAPPPEGMAPPGQQACCRLSILGTPRPGDELTFRMQVLSLMSQKAHSAKLTIHLFPGWEHHQMENQGKGIFEYKWTVPANFTGVVPIHFSVGAKDNAIVCSGRTEIIIPGPFRVSLRGPSSVWVGRKLWFTAKAFGGIPPFIFKFDLNGTIYDRESPKFSYTLFGISLGKIGTTRVQVDVRDSEGSQGHAEKK